MKDNIKNNEGDFEEIKTDENESKKKLIKQKFLKVKIKLIIQIQI